MSKKDWWYFAVWEVQIRLRHFIVHKLRCTVSNQNGISDSWTIDCTMILLGPWTKLQLWRLPEQIVLSKWNQNLLAKTNFEIQKSKKKEVRTDIQKRFFDQSLLNLNNYNFNDESLVTSLISVSCHPQGAFLTMLIVTMTKARRTETISNWICRWTIFFLQSVARTKRNDVRLRFLTWNFYRRSLVISL